MFTDRFIALGARVFSPGAWHRVPFQPVLYLFLWGAALRIVWDEQVPAPFQQTLSTEAENLWIGLGLVCPILSALAWWLIMHAGFCRSSLIGLWLRLAADIGMLTAIFVFHIADGLDSRLFGEQPAEFYSRYITAATLVFVFLVIVRDIWALTLTSRLARSMGRDE
jgi:hypothetical protein